LYNKNDGKWYFPIVETVQQGATAGLQKVAQKLGRFPSPTDD